MNKMFMLCLLNTMLMVCGQMLFKLGSRGKNMDNLMGIIRTLFSPVVLLALCLYGGTTILWLYILSKIDISKAYSIQALAFPLVLILSSILFKEYIPVNRWIGVGIIFVGVYVAVYR